MAGIVLLLPLLLVVVVDRIFPPRSHPGVSKQNIAQRKEGWVLSRGDILNMSLQIAFGSRLSRASLFLWGKSSVTEGCLWILSPEDFFFFVAGKIYRRLLRR